MINYYNFCFRFHSHQDYLFRFRFATLRLIIPKNFFSKLSLPLFSQFSEIHSIIIDFKEEYIRNQKLKLEFFKPSIIASTWESNAGHKKFEMIDTRQTGSSPNKQNLRTFKIYEGINTVVTIKFWITYAVVSFINSIATTIASNQST